ncbi:hypothetical protein ACVWY3_001609 [Bradyrhizobium sp. USDA 4486]
MVFVSLFSTSVKGARGFFPSHAVAFESDAVGVVDDPVEDSVCDGRLADHVVPLRNGQLGGNQGRFAPIALFEDFEEIKALRIPMISPGCTDLISPRIPR